MNKSFVLGLITLLAPQVNYAQSEQMLTLADNLTSILSQDNLQNLQNAKELSKLEDQANLPQCLDSNLSEKVKSCNEFAESLIPKGYKDKGWKTLFEIKYRPIEQRAPRSLARASYSPIDLSNFRNGDNNERTELLTEEQLEKETQKVMQWMRDSGHQSIDALSIKTQLIIDQFTADAYYDHLPTLAAKNDLMMSRVKTYSKSMDDQEFLRFVSMMAGYVDYNHDRNNWIQEDKAALGTASAFEQINGTKNGICGDIHAMAAKIAEQRGWEAFTVGYALKDGGHAVTAMVNPNDPDKLMVVNYGKYEVQDLNKGQVANPTPESEMSELGIEMRIFKNDDTGNAMGKMNHIATIPTALGSFMNDLFKKDYQISKAMPQNENFRHEKATAETQRHRVKVKQDGDKITDKLAGEGLVIYEGGTDGAQVFGIGVSHDVYKDIYRYDEKEGKCVLKKNKYFSIGVAGNIIDQERAGVDKNFYAYLNIKGGEIFHLFQTERFQFKGLIGYEIDGIMGATTDANLSSFLGVIADYKNNGTQIHTALKYETTLGLKNQELQNDISALPSNIKPFSFNAVSLDVNASQKIGDNTALVSQNNFTMTRVGGRVLLSTGIIHKNTSIMASYQGGFTPLNIGDSLQHVNLLQNFNGRDGYKLTVGQKFTMQNRSMSGFVSGYLESDKTSLKPVSGGASVKLNLWEGSKRKKERAR